MAGVTVSIDLRFKAAMFEAGLPGMSIHIGTSPRSGAQGMHKQLGTGLAHYLLVISAADATHYIGQAPQFQSYPSPPDTKPACPT